MKFGVFRFVPTLWPTLFFLMLLPLFISLGIWQINRANEKILILEDLEKKKSSVEQKIELLDPAADENSRIRLSGEIITAQQFLLDNKVHKTVAGYEIFTPIKLGDDGRFVLVSRGWIAQGRSRSELPDIKLEVASLRDASGLFVTPSRGFTIGEAFDPSEATWPRVIQYLDYAKIGSVLGGDLIEGVVQLDKPLGKEHPRLWQPVAFGPEKHYGYAAQWFAIALVLVVLYIVLNTKKEDSQ